MAIFIPSSFTIQPQGSRLIEVALPRRTSQYPANGPNSSTAPVHFMGGGPRTYPGGVTKWQWKRMQLKKTRQIEKARLMREKHIYEARRRAELMSVSPVLEMPWQKLSRVRPPNYVTSDEQITKLAARFQKEGAEDLWTERDGPERFEVMNFEQNEGFDQQDLSDSAEMKEHGCGNTEGSYPQTFRQIPRIRPGSTSFPKPISESYKPRSRRHCK